jgi:hypothetical protein
VEREFSSEKVYLNGAPISNDIEPQGHTAMKQFNFD